MSGQKKKEVDLEAIRKQRAISDIRQLVSTEHGRRWYWRLLEKANAFGISFSDSAAQTAFREGRRALALEVMAEVQRYSPAEHVLAMEEALKVQRDDESLRQSAAAKAETDE